MNGLIAGRPRRFDLGVGLALAVGVLVSGCGVQMHLTAPETGNRRDDGHGRRRRARAGTAGTMARPASGRRGGSRRGRRSAARRAPPARRAATGDAGTTGAGGRQVGSGAAAPANGARGGTSGGDRRNDRNRREPERAARASRSTGSSCRRRRRSRSSTSVTRTCAGRPTKPSSLRSYFYDTQDGLWSYKGSFTLAKEPTAPEGTMTLAGPGMAILHSAQMAGRRAVTPR